MSKKILEDLIRGAIIGLVYFQVTAANDTTLINISKFALFFIILVRGARVVGIDSNVIANAFLTKTVFTLVDERLRRPKDEPTETNK